MTTRADVVARNTKHGHSARGKESSEHRSWRGMIERCENPRHVGFKYYGARGVKVCERWRKDFAAFLSDIGLKPSPIHSIDRYPDTNGNYEPTNCRWATPSEQRANQREYDERIRVLEAWKTRSRVSKNRIDLTGRRFGRLLVLSYAETNTRRAYWLCLCDCGTEKVISGKSLRRGTTTSCGCLNREKCSERATIRNRTDNPAKYRWA